jgi:hypothetical protein
MKRTFLLTLFLVSFFATSYGQLTVKIDKGSLKAYSVRVPSGYQGHLEYSNLFYLKGGTSMSIATTHGFYYSPNMFIGLGLGLHIAPDNVFVPVFASAKYIFNYTTRVSPAIQMRMGSFTNEDGVKPYCDMSMGLRFASERDFAFSIQLCGSYFAPFNSTRGSYWDETSNRYVTTTEKVELSNVGLRLGIEW